MGKFIYETGNKYGLLTVIERAGSNKHNIALWLCQCECGRKKVIPGQALRSGNTKSCGCGRSGNGRTHGLSKNILYKLWLSMKNRCNNPNTKCYPNYGKRGIKVCLEWENNPETFITWCLKNGYKKGLHIDRIDNDKGYSPDNCRFATRQINNQNTRMTKLNSENVIKIRNLHSSKEISSEKLAEIFSVSRDTIYDVVNEKTWKNIEVTT
jgi:hypothetical protein